MSTTPYLTSHHPAVGYQPQGSIPARRPARKFVPAPVHVQAPATTAAGETDELSAADAVLELLRSVNRNGVRQ